MRYADIKDLLRDKCGFTDLILDNLTNDGKGKRVTVGLADENDANLLIARLHGYFLNGSQLYVEDVRKKKVSYLLSYNCDLNFISLVYATVVCICTNNCFMLKRPFL